MSSSHRTYGDPTARYEGLCDRDKRRFETSVLIEITDEMAEQGFAAALADSEEKRRVDNRGWADHIAKEAHSKHQLEREAHGLKDEIQDLKQELINLPKIVEENKAAKAELSIIDKAADGMVPSDPTDLAKKVLDLHQGKESYLSKVIKQRKTIAELTNSCRSLSDKLDYEERQAKQREDERKDTIARLENEGNKLRAEKFRLTRLLPQPAILGGYVDPAALANQPSVTNAAASSGTPIEKRFENLTVLEARQDSKKHETAERVAPTADSGNKALLASSQTSEGAASIQRASGSGQGRQQDRSLMAPTHQVSSSGWRAPLNVDIDPDQNLELDEDVTDNLPALSQGTLLPSKSLVPSALQSSGVPPPTQSNIAEQSGDVNLARRQAIAKHIEGYIARKRQSGLLGRPSSSEQLDDVNLARRQVLKKQIDAFHPRQGHPNPGKPSSSDQARVAFTAQNVTGFGQKADAAYKADIHAEGARTLGEAEEANKQLKERSSDNGKIRRLH